MQQNIQWNKIQEIDQLTKGKTKLTLQYPHKVSKAEIVMDTYLKVLQIGNIIMTTH